MSRALRRLVAGGVTIILATVGLELVGTVAASAHANAVNGSVGCQADGTYTVTWQIANDYDLTEAVKAVGHTPGSAAVSPSGISIEKNGSGTMTESNIPGTSTSASLSVSGTWSDGYYQGDSGSVTLGGSCRPSHTPAAPTAANGSCGSGHSQIAPTITIPSDSGVTYKLDGTTKAAGTYPVTAGSHTVVASSSTLTLRTPTSWTFHVSSAPYDCSDVVGPEAPTIGQSHCISGSSAPSAASLTLASTTGVMYSVSPSGPYSGGQTVTVTATAGSGYEFTSPGSAGWIYVDPKHETRSVTFDAAPNCQATVSPQPPSVTQAACGPYGSPTAPTLTPATTADVTYSVSPAGPFEGGETVTVTATAAAGTEFLTDAPSGWTSVDSSHETYKVTFAASPRCAEPTAPTFVDDVCTYTSTTPATYTIPNTPGVDYYVGGTKTAPGTYPAPDGSTVVVTAQPQSGYTLVGIRTWTHTFTDTPVCDTVSPASPAISQAACLGYGAPSAPALTPASTPGITYSVSAASPYSPGQVVTVTATANAGFGFVAPAPDGWVYVDSTHETDQVTLDVAPTCVSPENPTVTQSTCPASGTAPIAPTLAFAATPGVTYAVSPSGPFGGGQTVTVTAAAAAGFEFFTNAPTGWTYLDSTHERTQVTFDASAGCVEAVAPTFHDPTCTGPNTATNGTYTIPRVTGLEYLVNGVPTPAGNYTIAGGTTLVVTAMALPGYTLTDSTWTHTFPAADFTRCVDGIVAAQVSFKNTVCSANGNVLSGTYTVPDTTGVVYSIKGATVAAGTYAATTGSTVTIMAAAKTGFTLGGVTQWTHEFAAPKHCGLQVGSVTTPPNSTPVSSATPANTGVPIGEILLTGLALVLMGVACFAGTTIRRHGKPTT